MHCQVASAVPSPPPGPAPGCVYIHCTATSFHTRTCFPQLIHCRHIVSAQLCRLAHRFNVFHYYSAIMSSDQVQNAQKSAGQTADQTKEFGEEKTGQAHKNAQGVGQAAQDKAGQAQQGTADAAKTAQTKATEAKDGAGGALQQAGNKVSETFNNIKNAASGN